MFQFFSYFEAGNRSRSVHFPLIFCLKFQIKRQTDANAVSTADFNKYEKFVWRQTLKDKFLTKSNSLYDNFKEVILNKLDININDCVQSIVELYQKAGECMKLKSGNSKSNSRKQEPLWDSQCDILKKEKYKALRVFRITSNFQNLNRYKEIRNRYKEACKCKKLIDQKRNRYELIASRSNMSLFWRTVKKFRYKSKLSNCITTEVWVSHFKKLLHIENAENLKDNIND